MHDKLRHHPLSFVSRMKRLSEGLFCLLAVGTVTFAACTNDPYESGDAAYSYLRADFVDAYTGADTCRVVSVLTDDGEQMDFAEPISCSWAHVADSTYRALLYYNKVETGPVPISLVPVLFLRPKPLEADEAMHTDPVVFESGWESANGKYYNLGFVVKTGLAEEVDDRHVIGLVPVSETKNADGTKTIGMQLYHNRNGIPEYYSVRTYASVALSDFRKGDTLRLSIPTYDGVVVRDIVR